MTDLVEYGITTSRAHYWVHVCPDDSALYTYPRKRMLALMAKYETKTIASARGHVVPILQNLVHNGGIIWPCDLPFDWFKQFGFSAAASDHDVGKIAERCFKTAVSDGFFRLPVAVEFAEEIQDQYQGFDFRARLHANPALIEVKADIVGGVWGSGNLFVQTHEGGHKHAERNGHRAAA
jgi:hypothetical protein